MVPGLAMSVCYPYGRTIACVCNSHDQVINCFPTLEMGRERDDGGRVGGGRGEKGRQIKDNQTEILLAATALVAVTALFLR